MVHVVGWTLGFRTMRLVFVEPAVPDHRAKDIAGCKATETIEV